MGMPFTEVVKSRAIISRTREESLKLLFVLRRITDELCYGTATLLHCGFHYFESLPADVFCKQEPSSLALCATAEL
jgi:hypothetical protein